ncbi:MAG TPA: alpha/beta-type small acid-soluble spore protein [Bacilli bacterium]|nr:alpha/beta-type small acid-soluble spore protein [Bacilli bacterium]
MPNRNNRAEVPGARNALDHLKTEVASELGVPNYDQIDKGALPSRLNGKVGGVMVRKMIEFAEEAMKSSPQALQQVEQQPGATQDDIVVAQQSLQAANAFMAHFDAGQAEQTTPMLLPPQAMQAGQAAQQSPYVH